MKEQMPHRIKTRVKTAKKRSLASTQWLQRQLNDPYVALAKQNGYRARSAFKLIELDDKLEVKVQLSYELFDIMKNYLKVNNFNILNTEFNDKISIVFIAPLSFNKESFNEYFLSRVKITEINDYIDKIEVGK